jgi:hypothetical protein
MTASGLRAAQPPIRSPLAYALVGLAAISLLVVGFAIGSSRAGSLQAIQPVAVAPSSVAGAPAAPAPGVVVPAVRLVPESFTYWLQGRTQSIATGPAVSRTAAGPACSRGTAVSDKPGSVVRASACEIIAIAAALDQTPGQAGSRPESSVAITGGPPAGVNPPADGSTSSSTGSGPVLLPGVRP